MRLEVVHSGGAVRTEDGAVWRLKDLLTPASLGRGQHRISRVVVAADGRLRLTLVDGSEHVVVCPPGPEPGDAGARSADLVLRNARQILTLDDDHGTGLRGPGVVACRRGRILGVFADERDLATTPDVRFVDARGGVVTPGLIDPHTHPVFAGERSLEFAMKAEGKSYLEVHHAGGGIFATVRATRAASTAELETACARNLSRLLGWGVTSCEGKSGYALDVEGELRLLEVLQTVSDCHPVDVVPTLLGAHALPPEFADRRAEYVRLVVDEMIPRASAAGTARFCDAYCEDGAFTRDEVAEIFTAARAAGLGLRLHAEQFSDQDGARLAAEMGAAAADHLEEVNPEGMAAMARSGTVAVLLPGAALTCRCPWPPARALIEAGVGIALGTDLNPGSSMTAALPLMMSLACTQMGLSCETAWRAVTRVAARSLERSDIGLIAAGARADLAVFDAPDYRYVPYHFGENHARVVIKDGQVVLDRYGRI